MWQLLAFWPSLGPVGRGVTLFCLGLAIGSFLSVLQHRLPRRKDPLRGRSECPHCGHKLGLTEMVPVLSYLVQGGRCRHCRAPISPIYPLLELGTGAIAAIGGAVSWPVGLLVIGTMICATWVTGRAQVRRTARGYMLVEVVVAFLLLALSIGAVLDLFGIVRHAVPAGYRRTEAVALARAQFSLLAQGLSGYSRQPAQYCNLYRGELSGADLLGLTELGDYVITVECDPAAAEPQHGADVAITVTCPQCPSRYGEALIPVTVRGYIRKRLQAGG